MTSRKSITLTTDEQIDAWNNLMNCVEDSDWEIREWGDSLVDGEVIRLAADAFTGRV
jgi:hypothetical protein